MKNSLQDYKGRTLKIGESAKVRDDIPSVNGMLHRNTIVKMDEVKDGKIRVTDRTGKIWWVTPEKLSVGYL